MYDAVTVAALKWNKGYFFGFFDTVHVLSEMEFYMFEMLASNGDLIIPLEFLGKILDLIVLKWRL